MLTNWKTSLAGISSILVALGDIAHSISIGTQPNFQADFAAIAAGIGLIFAKDHTN